MSFPTSRICLLQFATGLAILKVIKSGEKQEKQDNSNAGGGLKDLPIELKWPNDIYFDKRAKLGGILVKSSFMGYQQNIKIGVGFNLSNEHPTDCLNLELRKLKLNEWTNEQFIAKFLNEFEQILTKISSLMPSDINMFLNEYQDNWLHKYNIFK